VIAEIGRGALIDGHAHYLADAVERAQFGLGGAQAVKHRDPHGILRGRDVQLAADDTRVHRQAVAHRQHSRNEQKIAGPHRRHVRAQRSGRIGQ